MSIIPWRRKREVGDIEPFWTHPLVQFRRQMDALFERFFRHPGDLFQSDFPLSGLMAGPRTDLADAGDEITVTMELPGVDPKDVDIQISGDLLTVRGEKKAEKEERDKSYHYVERQYGSFQRSVQLPGVIDPDKVDASFKNGVLTIRIGKRPDVRPKKIKVRST